MKPKMQSITKLLKRILWAISAVMDIWFLSLGAFLVVFTLVVERYVPWNAVFFFGFWGGAVIAKRTSSTVFTMFCLVMFMGLMAGLGWLFSYYFL